MFRDGQEIAPLLVPTNLIQLRLHFASTYQATLTREGVEVDTFKFNSPELASAFLTNTGKVTVKVDPDDVRSVLVLHHHWPSPIEAFLSTFQLHTQVTFEMLKMVLARAEADGDGTDGSNDDIAYAFQKHAHLLQMGPSKKTPGKTRKSDAHAAKDAAAHPPFPAPRHSNADEFDLNDLLGGGALDD